MTATYDDVTRCLATAIKLSGGADSAKEDKTGGALTTALNNLREHTARRDDVTAARHSIRAARKANDMPELAEAESQADSELAAAESALVMATEQAERAKADDDEAHGLLRALLSMQDILQGADATASPSALLLNDLACKILTTAASRHGTARFDQLVSKYRANVIEATRVKTGAELAASHAEAAAGKLPTMRRAVAATKLALQQSDCELKDAQSALALALNQQTLAKAPITHLIELQSATEALLTAAKESDRLTHEREEQLRLAQEAQQHEMLIAQMHQHYDREKAARADDWCTCDETTTCNNCLYPRYNASHRIDIAE
ncbi:MAG: hypothetical protein K2W95_10275 [Candidatus Obscuribacterales bacterium]|nr:hypothetical protein [Candidatus Obscuribacterales bacterium]